MVLAACALFSCAAPAADDDYPPRRTSPCGNRFEPAVLDPIPDNYRGIHPNVEVRAQVFRCHDGFWVGVGGAGYGEVNAQVMGAPAACAPGSGAPILACAVKGPSHAPFPYQNMNAALPFGFPLEIAPGIEVAVAAQFRVLLDEDWGLSCWLADRDGRDIPGSRSFAVSSGIGASTVVDCLGVVTG